MNSCHCLCESDSSAFIRREVIACGACACGIASAGPTADFDRRLYSDWLGRGDNAGMSYMERNCEMRENPRLLFPGAATVVVAAFNYRPESGSELFADYALGYDYHHVLHRRLGVAAETLVARFGGSCRVVVDSAPMRERYWAQRSGIGFVADNGQLCVPGYGMAVFLGFILWTGVAEPDSPYVGECMHCGRCVRACPGVALNGKGGVDARRCLSYLTIEHRGEFPADMPSMPKVYGCDNCRRCCPLDVGPSTDIAEFAPLGHLALTPEEMIRLTAGRFRQIFGQTAINRLRVQGLRRNALLFSRTAEIRKDESGHGV